MSIEHAKDFFRQQGLEDRVLEFDVSSATVELAAQAVGTEPARIAKTLSFRQEDGCLLIVTAGDAKIDNAKYKAQFHTKAKMLSAQEALEMTGYAVGGVCPFALPSDIPVYLDVSMRRFETVFPACGSSSSAVRLTLEELYRCAGASAWVDVCKGWQQEEV